MGQTARHRTRLALAATALTVTSTLAIPAAPATASECSWAGCGEVINHTFVTLYSKSLDTGEVRAVAPGQDAGGDRGGLKDVDAYTFTSTHFYVYGGSSFWIRREAGYWQNVDDPYEVECTQQSGYAPRCQAYPG